VEKLNKLMQGKTIDIGVIGIGENAHIAFNDPPADFECDDAYKIVNLDDRCKMQQVGEGWFATIDDVPKQAISMTVKQIMRCTKIVSPVPYAVEAIRNTLLEDISPMVPATKLREHPDCTLYLDKDSAKKIDIIGGKVIGK
jgi:glucosamine-6-phosphate deaminase